MSKKNRKNIVFGLIGQFIILSIGLVVPRIILVNYGSDTNGLTSTISQIFTYMALLEAGIGQATTNALYKYINGEKKDRDGISQIISISKVYYSRITVIYGLAVIIVALILPLVLKTNVDHITVFLIVIFEGMTGVVSFGFIQKWTTLLIADGQNYVVSNLETLDRILCYSIKVILALKGVNIALIQVGYFIASLIKLLIYKIYMTKYYSWVDYKRSVKGQKLKDKNAYIVTELAWTVFSSTDMIILSIFCSTGLSSVYSIYNMVYLALNKLLNSVYNGLKYNLGQTYFNNTENYIKTHDLYNSLFVGIMTILMCVTYLLIVPFVKIYTKGITDIDYVIKGVPLLFCLIQMLSWARYISGNLTAIAGYARYTGVASIIEAVLNVVFSIILVAKFELIGVLLATVLALPVKAIYCNYLADIKIMKRKPNSTIKILAGNWVIFLMTVLIENVIKIEINTYLSFFVVGFVLVIVYSIIVFVVNCIMNKDLYYKIKGIIKCNKL